MEKEKFYEYLKDRYQNQVGWYSKNARTNKHYYLYFQWGVIILSASLPFLISLPKSQSSQFIIGGISIILAIGTAALKTFKFQENWITYRSISEALKREKYYYDAELDTYAGAANKETIFVGRVEAIIAGENTSWMANHTQKDTDLGKNQNNAQENAAG